MLENTDNDLPKASEENVSEHTSKTIPESENTAAAPVEDAAEATEQEKITAEEKADTSANKTTEEGVETEEDTVAQTQEGVEQEQFRAMEPKELAALFAEKIKDESVQHLKSTIESLVKIFDQKLAAEAKKQKEAFIAEGENPDAFYFNPPIKKEFNELYRQYKSDRSNYYRSLEEKQQKNLTYRKELIEELKGLINVDTNINTTYNQFKDLQKRWKESGQVPRMEANNIWKTYHHHVGHFYDFLHLNRELR